MVSAGGARLVVDYRGEAQLPHAGRRRVTSKKLRASGPTFGFIFTLWKQENTLQLVSDWLAR